MSERVRAGSARPALVLAARRLYNPGMWLPFLVFWAIVFFARHELAWRGVALCVAIWVALLAGFMWLGISPYVFIAAQSMLDCVLILVIFRGDIRIR